MSFILISVKNRTWDVPRSTLKREVITAADDAVEALGLPMDSCPYLALTMALRLKRAHTVCEKRFEILEQKVRQKRNRIVALATGFDEVLYTVL